MLLHQFVTRPLSDTEKQVLAVANGCMAIAESPDDDWDRFLDLIEHNKNEFAYDLGFILLECREQPDRVEQLYAALAGMIERDASGFLEALNKHPLKPGELPILLGSVKPTQSAGAATFSPLLFGLGKIDFGRASHLVPVPRRTAPAGTGKARPAPP